MKKILLFSATLSLFLLLASCQSEDTKPAPSAPGNVNANAGSEETATVQSLAVMAPSPPQTWYCTISFYVRGKPYYTENIDQDNMNAYRGRLGSRADNRIAEFSWEGSQCNCWVVVYQTRYWQGINLGFWTGDYASSNIDLGNYITWDSHDGAWEDWDKSVSSYAVYCS